MNAKLNKQTGVMLTLLLLVSILILGAKVDVASAQDGMSGGPGDDTAVNTGTIVAADDGIDTGAGDDTIDNSGTITAADAGIDAGSGDDTVDNSGEIDAGGTGIDGGGGDDTINNEGDVDGTVGIDGEGGDDTITNSGTVSGAETAIDGGSGDDTITNTEDGVVNGDIDGNSGDDTIVNEGIVNGDVNGGPGDDSVTVADEGLVAGDVNGDGGDDEIVITGTVEGDVNGNGGDDAVIILEGAVVDGELDGGDGDDVLTLDFEVRSVSQAELDAWLAELAAQAPGGGQISFGGIELSWVNFEELRNMVRFALITQQTFQIRYSAPRTPRVVRLNGADPGAPFAIYCTDAGEIEVWDIDALGRGTFAFRADQQMVEEAMALAASAGRPSLVASGLGDEFYALPNGWAHFRGPELNNPLKLYIFETDELCEGW